MRSTTVPRPALYHVSVLALLLALPLLFFPVSRQGPGKADNPDLVRAQKLLAEKQWAAARASFDAAGQALSEHGRPEVRQALRGAVTCSLRLSDGKGAWQRTQTFWRDRTGAALRREQRWIYDREEEQRDYQWI